MWAVGVAVESADTGDQAGFRVEPRLLSGLVLSCPLSGQIGLSGGLQLVDEVLSNLAKQFVPDGYLYDQIVSPIPSATSAATRCSTLHVLLDRRPARSCRRRANPDHRLQLVA